MYLTNTTLSAEKDDIFSFKARPEFFEYKTTITNNTLTTIPQFVINNEGLKLSLTNTDSNSSKTTTFTVGDAARNGAFHYKSGTSEFTVNEGIINIVSNSNSQLTLAPTVFTLKAGVNGINSCAEIYLGDHLTLKANPGTNHSAFLDLHAVSGFQVKTTYDNQSRVDLIMGPGESHIKFGTEWGITATQRVGFNLDCDGAFHGKFENYLLNLTTDTNYYKLSLANGATTIITPNPAQGSGTIIYPDPFSNNVFMGNYFKQDMLKTVFAGGPTEDEYHQVIASNSYFNYYGKSNNLEQELIISNNSGNSATSNKSGLITNYGYGITYKLKYTETNYVDFKVNQANYFYGSYETDANIENSFAPDNLYFQYDDITNNDGFKIETHRSITSFGSIYDTSNGGYISKFDINTGDNYLAYSAEDKKTHIKQHFVLNASNKTSIKQYDINNNYWEIPVVNGINYLSQVVHHTNNYTDYIKLNINNSALKIEGYNPVGYTLYSANMDFNGLALISKNSDNDTIYSAYELNVKRNEFEVFGNSTPSTKLYTIKIGAENLTISNMNYSIQANSATTVREITFTNTLNYLNTLYSAVLSWKINVSGNGETGLYGSQTGLTNTPVIKGFDIYDKDGNQLTLNAISGSYLPLTGGTIQGTNSTDKMIIGDKSLLLERYDNNERVSYVYLASGVSRNDFVPDFTMNTTKSFTKNGTTINYYQNQISTSGYSWNLGSENIYIFPTGIELVSNGLQSSSSSSKKYGQINLNLNGLEIQNKDANGTITHNLKLDSGTNTAQVYLLVDDGKNKWAQFNVDGLSFGGTDKTLDSLYFNTDGVGYATKETLGRQVQYSTTRWSHKISYKNQTETGTIEFKPIDTDGAIKLAVSNKIYSTTNTVTIYNGHTSTTQTNFDDADYITKKYSDDQYEDLLEKYIALEARVRALEPPIVSNYLKTKSLDTISFNISSQNADDDYTIDWGDGNTSQSGNGTNISHNYSTTDSYTIKIIPNNDDADGKLSGLRDLITEINISNIDCPNITEDNTIEKITINNMIIQSGSWYSAFASELGVLEELHIKDNCRLSYENPVAEYCPNLIKITIDSEITNLGQDLVTDCPNVEELHLTSTTMPTFIDTNYSLFDNIPQNLTIYVPNDLVNDYKTALPDYVNYIVGE